MHTICAVCQRGLRANVSACQRTKSVPTSHFFCQRTIRCSNASIWCSNVLNGMPTFQLGVPTCQRGCKFFKHSSYQMLREIDVLYFYVKNYPLCLILYLYIPCANCIILHFYTSCHIKEKCVELLFFETFLVFS